VRPAGAVPSPGSRAPRAPLSPERWRSIKKSSGRTVQLGIAVPGEVEAHLIGRHTGVGFEVTDLQAEDVRLTGLGVVVFTMPPTRQPWGGVMARLSDPDGNVFYLDRTSAAHGP